MMRREIPSFLSERLIRLLFVGMTLLHTPSDLDVVYRAQGVSYALDISC